MTIPAIGSFIRPVGRYAYCLEVINVVPLDRHGPSQWQCKRWGLTDDKQPLNDGHHGMSYLDGLVPVGQNVWKDLFEGAGRWHVGPRYFRQIDIKPLVTRQLDLFS